MTRVTISFATADVCYGPMICSAYLLSIFLCIRADAFLLARASLQIRLQPRAVVANRLLVFSRCKAKKRRNRRGGMRGNIMRTGEGGKASRIEQGGFEKRGKSEGAPLQIEWRRRPDGFIVEAIESTNTTTTNRLSRENATRAEFD